MSMKMYTFIKTHFESSFLCSHNEKSHFKFQKVYFYYEHDVTLSYVFGFVHNSYQVLNIIISGEQFSCCHELVVY